ncbi:hypothetical protein [Amycolatopsis sp. CA-128772]|uniref:hypothetical protein n=1 Tax=Amycolatopsis sp. CA-128772 TaxID=2073159 RepID=UPI000CD27E36|nr:hypothetical protein [Amycolatopsis sp. CA-128772]
MSTGLASPDDLTAYLGVEPPSAEQAAFLLAAATAVVRSYCGWSITKTEDVTAWTVDSRGGAVLTVPTLYLRSVVAVIVRGTPVDLSEITFSASGVLVRPRHPWPVGLGSVAVQGTHGYDQAPADVVAVVCSLASRGVALAGKGPVTSYRVGGVQVNYAANGVDATGLSTTETAVIDGYRLREAR